jgi:endonuclease YncB( thermonuclease family)
MQVATGTPQGTRMRGRLSISQRTRWLALRACSLVVLSNSALAHSWTVEGRLVGVADGDTSSLFDRGKRQRKFRHSVTDAPEKGQGSGERSQESLSRLVFDRQVKAL